MARIHPKDIAGVARSLEPLGTRMVFVGGAIVPMLLDDPALADVRHTVDIDVAVGVSTRLEYSKIEEKLIALHLTPDTSNGAPKCRWIINEIKVDVMPVEDPSGEWRVKWFDVALETATAWTIEDMPCLIASAPSFIATKMEAFADRGNGDYHGSHDIEDIITVIDGRSALLDEIGESAGDLRHYLVERMGNYVADDAFKTALPGHLPPDSASQQRLPMLLGRLDAIAGLSV